MARKPFRRVGIVAKPHSPIAGSVLRRLVRWLERRRIPYRCGPGAAQVLEARREAAGGIFGKVDLVVVLGGDGTLLSVAREVAPFGIPILGVNLGSLGFLTEFTLAEMTDSLGGVLAGRCAMDRRMMLDARLFRGRRLAARHHLLNDVVLNKSALARIIDIDVDIDGRYITSYRADGLIVCTPTGSTAYSLSAGGPILHPDLRSFCITPICPHTLANRPLVIPAPMTVAIRPRVPAGENVYLTLDGQVGFPLHSGDRVEVRRSRHTIRLVRVPGKPYFDVLRRKLKWGGK
ncbi:MAG: NAD(+)/NADH kinase [Acidobacteria bacterium]|nr:NAD(+)/NADH kinase [Acidobacteriota bacterium]